MNIKKDDKVIVVSGKDKGHIGKVVRAFPKENLILLEGVNVKKKHAKAKKGGKKGQIIDKAYPINVSNVKIVDPETGKGVRIGKKMVDGKYVRISRKSGREI